MINTFKEALKKQGFSIMLLCVAVSGLVWYIQYINNKQEVREKEQDARIAECHDEMEAYLAKDRVSMIRALDNNTRALEDVTFLLKRAE